MRIRSRRQLGGTLAWAASLASLVSAAGLSPRLFGDEPGVAVGSLAAMALTAGVVGVVLGNRVVRARSEALLDPLTGLPNRALLEDRVEQALRRSRRSGEGFALILVDLDGFKDVNDVRGHSAGDAVLKELARRLEQVMRDTDTVARIGGDEFVVLSVGTEEDTQAAALVDRLRHALRRPFHVQGTTVEIDASLGWALFPADGITSEELLSRADDQMYSTKRDAMHGPPLVRRAINAGVIKDVESAVARNELVVVYQPILDLRTGEPHAAEALVRRLLPNHTLLPPQAFVPHVERTSLVRELTFLVIEDALRSAASWRETGHELGVSINIPYRLLNDPLFADGLARLRLSDEWRPGSLTLEIVPGTASSVEFDKAVLGHLSELGVRLSLDDGGRAASFAALRVLPLDELKIDAAFVHGLGHSATDDALVHGMIEIGHSLGLSVVAEGVETREALNALTAWGCDYAQGFYVAAPHPAKDFAEWLAGRWPAVA